MMFDKPQTCDCAGDEAQVQQLQWDLVGTVVDVVSCSFPHRYRLTARNLHRRAM